VTAPDTLDGARERVRSLVDRGAPWEACDAFREAGGALLDDASWLFLGALAHARAGAETDAHALLDRAANAPGAAAPQMRGEILALRGRLCKDALYRTPPGAEADAHATRARDEYLAAHALARDPYPGVNAATLSMLLGERDVAQALATEVEATLAQRGGPLAGWDLLTAAEAALLRGDAVLAHARFAAAWAEAAHDAGRVASVRRQLRLLARVLPAANDLLPVVRAPDVVAFTGHMLDAPGRETPRFPPSLVPVVEAALREHVAAWHAPVVYTSAACGADLLFVEAAQAVGAEVNVVLPFARDEFVGTSVAPGGAPWVERFERVLARAARVIYATEEAHLGDDILFRHAAQLVEGLAVLRAAQFETEPTLLAVFDAVAAGRIGGTRDAVERWQRGIGPVRAIDLADLRRRMPGAASGDVPRTMAGAVAPSRRDDASAIVATGAGRPARSLKAMVFADFAGYSRIADANVARFQQAFWSLAASAIAASGAPPDFANTWGDGLYLVYDAPHVAASFALGLRAAMDATDWQAFGLPAGSRIRIGLHAGPVFRGFDPVIGRDNFFGASVTRAARIEPVTPPGTVFASEPFAATLAAAGTREFLLEYVGRVGLAKGYGEARVYRLARRLSPSVTLAAP
jgi:hypothetical protein